MKTATEVVKLDHVISDLLPSCQTGSVEVQRDLPHHEHELIRIRLMNCSM
ncbi:hypothetical protein [Geomicrobium sp. JCM 19037]|nr:hypothetical protein [Geomicrobium sp. JCM 19037]